MLSSEIHDKLKCAISKDTEHYLVHPIALQCGHSVCKKCIPDSTDVKIPIKCVMCGDIGSVNLKKIVEFQYIKQLFKANFNILRESTIENSEGSMRKLIGIADDIKSRVRKQVDYAKDEIEIRVESIKVDLDELSERLKTELDTKQDELFKYPV
jgi:hypothetical protein